MLTGLSKFPFCFDVAQLQKEAIQFSEADWLVHEHEAAGDASLPLVSVGGTCNIDYAISGQVDLTNALARSPYLQQVLQAFESPLSRCRLVRQVIRVDDKRALVSEQNYHWFRRSPIYVPIFTDAAVSFAYGTERIRMAAGEAWTFDPRTPHGFVGEAEMQTKGDTGHNNGIPPVSIW